ncbi:MAG: hypothetical protein CL626_02510, partial [Aurantimonas sp.]|nr:hypothetical protein [Aurantimonas sp.]
AADWEMSCMSIHLRLIIGSSIFAVLALLFAAFSYHSQSVSLGFAQNFYDGGIDPLGRLQVAKGKTVALAESLGAQETASGDDAQVRLDPAMRTISSIKADVQTALAQSGSAEVRAMLSELLYPLSRLEASGGNMSARMAAREIASTALVLDRAVTAMNADLVQTKSEAVGAIESARLRNLAGLAAILIGMAGFAVFLSRSVGASLRRVSGLARNLASGIECDMIEARGPSEVRDVLNALRQMQEHCEKLETMMLDKVDLMAGRLNTQQDQLTAALNNMTQALCMLDGQKRMILCNETFTELFGDHPAGTNARDFFTDARLTGRVAPNDTASHIQEVGEGQIMEVKRRGMSGDGLLITFEDITEREAIARRLQHLSGHDALTELPNRGVFAEILDEALGKGRKALTIAVIDIRGFKTINDTYGHPVGDAILRQCGARLIEKAGAKATVARLGGNEFAVILLGGRSAADAEDLARSMVASFDEPFEVEGRNISAAGSVGALYVAGGKRPVDLDAAIALQNCDLALYQAKQSAGSSYRMFQPSMRQKLQQRRELEIDLQKAIEEGQFELFYQPFVDTGRRAISGFEALLRWNHPERGRVSPSTFIPLAEETGMITEIGLWALETACEQAASWVSDLAISVNLSAVQFKSPTLVADVRRVLAKSGLQPSRLQIEVTESLFLDEGDKVLSILTEFRRMGLTISMDDFGTGYSSLGYLNRFPFDKIKIDQSFVRDMSRPENIAIVRSVIGLSNALDMRVIAEGIETPEQMRILYAEGCREMQGYYFSRPRPASDLPKMLVEIADRWPHEFEALTQNALDPRGAAATAA